ncbi:MAG: 3-hydroxyacyl-CoA dehydrogenase/enoyl-CoA hydratase family protein [Deltaproteobacteria bacterium]|nr:3-hydroxyacyl-CoA dehydrogenase/enoyl-CoA hydratase family protein [Deltaproteobacteria bacterium]
MSYEIKKAAIIGAGVMGATIAAHMTNAGIECVMLDIVPPFDPSEKDLAKGLKKESKAWRNSFASNGLNGALKSKPASFYSKKNASLISIGNLEDDLDMLKDVDFLLEVVVENLKIKQDLFTKLEKVVRPDCIIGTNTSGLPIKDIAAPMSAKFKERFLGIHFFNPPRYMKLVEVIPGETTKQEIVDYMTYFLENVLGKGVVICKDVPNFIANRIGVFDISNAVKTMLEHDLTIPELDAIIAKVLGRPGSAICGTIDLVGIDTGYHVMKNLVAAVPDDEMIDTFSPPEFMDKMVQNKWLGNKTKQGFYKKTKDEKGKKVKLALDYKTMEYVPFKKPKFESVSEAAKVEGGFDDKLKSLFYSDKDMAGDIVREYLCKNFIYSANRIPEICDTVYQVDNTMKWGYNHAKGPFETWDAVGLKDSLEVMKKLKLKVPKKITEMVKNGFESFYAKKEDGLYYYDFEKKDYVKMGDNPKIIILADLKEKKKVVKENVSASLIDIGDGVVCLEFHTKMNAIDPDMISMIDESCDIVMKDFVGMVVANQATNFCVGANIFQVLLAAQQGDWDMLDKMVHDLQYANMKMKYLEKPVVTAPAGMALGGGCEVSIHGQRCQPCGETYMGLVEVGVGVIPAGGGCKELMVRCTEGIPDGVVDAGMNMQPIYEKVLMNIAQAKVATSAMEAMELGYIRKTENISLNRDHQIWDAKELVLSMAKTHRKRTRDMIPVMGKNLEGIAHAVLFNMKHGNYMSEYDEHVTKKIAWILSGGDCPENTFVTEDAILDREREAFLSLAGEQKTQDRIMHMLTKGKPLRN